MTLTDCIQTRPDRDFILADLILELVFQFYYPRPPGMIKDHTFPFFCNPSLLIILMVLSFMESVVSLICLLPATLHLHWWRHGHPPSRLGYQLSRPLGQQRLSWCRDVYYGWEMYIISTKIVICDKNQGSMNKVAALLVDAPKASTLLCYISWLSGY